MKRYYALFLIAAVLLLALIAWAVTSFGEKGNDLDVFNPANLPQAGRLLTTNSDISSHGQVSLDYIIHMNDYFTIKSPAKNRGREHG